jgi:hypothetical protein
LGYLTDVFTKKTIATSSDNLGLQFNWRTSPHFELGGWFGYTKAYQERGGNSKV